MKNLPAVYAFPDNEAVFARTYSQAELDAALRAGSDAFAYAAFPLRKHRWRGAYVCLQQGVFKLNLELEEHETPERAPRAQAERFEPEESDTRALLHRAGARSMTFECYSFLRCRDGTPVAELDAVAQRGLVVGGNRLRIFSGPRRARASAADSAGMLRNELPFERAPFASLSMDAQQQLFRAWVTRSTVVVTGGTGVGKTSQVPKLMLWFNYLFGGFESLAVLGPARERPVVLSLPRVALVRLNAQALLRALGFRALQGSPVEMRYGAMPEAELNEARLPYRLILSTNKLTLGSLFAHGTVVLDEIHEHDQMTDIIIAVLRKHRARVDAVVLMSATLEDDRERLQEFFPEALFVHIPGPTRFPIRTVYVRNASDPRDVRAYAQEEKRNLALALRRHRPPAGACGILFVASVAQCEDYRRYLAQEHPELDFHVVHGKTPHVDALLERVYASPRASVLVATPYLESSVTLRTVTHVYDTGRVYLPAPFGGRQAVISRAMRTQRQGRVGRVRPGTYVYFYDPARMAPVKRIDSEFLYNYIIYAWHYGLALPEDLYVRPSDEALLRRCEQYLDALGVPRARLFEIASTHFLRMVEYAKIYARGGEQAEALDAFERYAVVNEDVLDAIRSLQLRARVRAARVRAGRYLHTCVVEFGPYAGTEFLLAHTRRLRASVLMVTERTFVPE
ncbi:ATP-dependent RNA helicase [Equine molluscum contagiosum-like virus]|nr:ATP-dependent RNA helicase [Equine molluscum contagiosum-like virus]